MTSVAKYVKDPEIRELLLRKDKDSDKDKGSIGTESTRTAIITNLITRGYIEKKGKNLISTQKGRELYNCLPDEIKKPDMTAKWWAIQEKIKENEATPQDLYNDVLETVNKIISQVSIAKVATTAITMGIYSELLANAIIKRTSTNNSAANRIKYSIFFIFSPP
jgi:DNA topoisomerase IA